MMAISGSNKAGLCRGEENFEEKNQEREYQVQENHVDKLGDMVEKRT